MIAQDFIQEGFPIYKILSLCKISRSSFYYRPIVGIRGRKPYAIISGADGQPIDEIQVLALIKELFENPFVDYGYFKTYVYLKKGKHVSISKNAVYLLMKRYNLLRNKYVISSKKSKRNWVKKLLPDAKEPFSYLEFDIKYIWVSGKQKNAQILTVIDVFSRWNLGQYIGFNIESQHVKQLFEEIFKGLYLPQKFFVRNDNGSQFIANEVQDFFKNKGIIQEFTKPATPQQNAHIESYHSIMESAICQRFEFNDINELRKTMQDFRNFYNFERIHGGIGFMAPFEYLQKKNFNINLLNFKPNPSLN